MPHNKHKFASLSFIASLVVCLATFFELCDIVLFPTIVTKKMFSGSCFEEFLYREKVMGDFSACYHLLHLVCSWKQMTVLCLYDSSPLRLQVLINQPH